MREREHPFRREGLMRRSAPFLVAMVVAFAAIRLPAVERDGSEILVAALVNVALIALVWFLPWRQLPRSAELLPPLVFLVVLALLRDALGGPLSAYSPLLTLPVLWVAMHGTRQQIAVLVGGAAVLLIGPILLIGEPDYTDEEWRRALIWVTVAGIVGLAVNDLVEQVRRRAVALQTVSEAVGRRTREIETRSAICEAAKQNAGADFALLLEPDANGRRLVTTAATDGAVEGTELFMTDPSSPALETYKSGRAHLQHAPHASTLTAPSGIGAQVASILWQPVPGRDGQLGVMALAWRQPVKRLPETLGPVTEALAAEAAAVIERTTLLLTLETTAKADELTGLPNERAWEEEVPRELARARRQRTPLSVAVVDLGDFETSPDGRLLGAEARVLRDAARAWRKVLRPGDFLAHRRPGRFSVLLPDLDADDVEAAVARMRAVAPSGRECRIAVATWNGVELPAAFVARAEAGLRAGALPPAA